MKKYKSCPNCGRKFSGIGVPNICVPVYKCKTCGKIYCYYCAGKGSPCPNGPIKIPIPKGQKAHPGEKIGEYNI